jgi:hypothetical protein
LAAYELFNAWQRKKREEEALDFYSFWLDFSLQEKYVKRIVLGTRVEEKEKGRGGRDSWEGGGRIGRRERGSEARRGEG